MRRLPAIVIASIIFCLFFTCARADDAPAASAVTDIFSEYIEYQALGKSFIFPAGYDAGLAPLPDPAESRPAGWQMLAAAWQQASLLPFGRFMLLERADVDIYLAVMRSDVDGNLVSGLQEKSFLSTQIWREAPASPLDFSQLEPGEPAGLGIISRDDNSLFAFSLIMPEDAQTPVFIPRAAMASSLTVVNGIPVVLGVGSEQITDMEELYSICRSLSLYLRLSNGLSETGFFHPDPARLVVAGRRLSLRLPAGACVLNASTPRQMMALIQLENMVHGSFYPLLAFAPCEALKAWENGPGHSQLTHYGLIGVNLEMGQLKVMEIKEQREFIQRLKAEQEGEPLAISQLDALDWLPIVAELPMGAVESLGHLGADRYAAYWVALLRTFNNPDESKGSGALAGIMAIGQANGLAVTSLLYRPIEEPGVFSILFKQQQNLLSSMNK